MTASKSARLLGRAWCTALAIVVFILLLQIGDETLRSHWRFDRWAILGNKEWWRMLSAHFVHLGWRHAGLNAIGVLLCCAIAPELFSPRVLLPRVVLLSLFIALMLLKLSPAVSHYVGLSGVLYGLFVLGLVPRARRDDLVAGAAVSLVFGWALWQCWFGPSASEERLIGGRIVAEAHLYGLLGSALLLVVLPRRPERDR